jgi:hypothetical protein
MLTATQRLADGHDTLRAYDLCDAATAGARAPPDVPAMAAGAAKATTVKLAMPASRNEAGHCRWFLINFPSLSAYGVSVGNRMDDVPGRQHPEIARHVT